MYFYQLRFEPNKKKNFKNNLIVVVAEFRVNLEKKPCRQKFFTGPTEKNKLTNLKI
jgi:hypothetical protein